MELNSTDNIVESSADNVSSVQRIGWDNELGPMANDKRQKVDLRTIACTRNLVKFVDGYLSDSVLSHGTEFVSVPANKAALYGARLATTIADGASHTSKKTVSFTTPAGVTDNGDGTYSLDGYTGWLDSVSGSEYTVGAKYLGTITITDVTQPVSMAIGVATIDGTKRVFNGEYNEYFTASTGSRSLFVFAGFVGTVKFEVQKVTSIWRDTDCPALPDYNGFQKNPYVKVTAIGDSITAGRDWSQYAEHASRYAIILDAGVSGNTTTQMLARFSADVLSTDAHIVTIQGGVNDIIAASSDPSSTIQANITAMVDATVAAGKVPVLFNLSPWSGYVSWSAEKQGWTESHNTWIAGYASANNIQLVDMYSVLGAGDALRAEYSIDGLHFDANGGSVIGVYAASAIDATTTTYSSNDTTRLSYLLNVEDQATNLLLNSSAPVTQTTASLGTGNYTLSVYGTGSAIASGNTATITGEAAATEGSPDTFAVTGAGTVDITVTGDLDYFQLESGNYATSVIVTAGTTLLRPLDSCSFNTPGAWSSKSGACEITVTPSKLATTSYILNTRVDVNNRTQIYIDGTTVRLLMYKTGETTIVNSYPYVHSVGTEMKVRFWWDDGFCNIKAWSTANPEPAWPSDTVLPFEAQIGTSITYGNNAGTLVFAGNYQCPIFYSSKYAAGW